MLATVMAGLIAGRKARPRALARRAPDWAAASGTSLIFLINGFVFMLIGLQLPAILAGLATRRRRPS